MMEQVVAVLMQQGPLGTIAVLFIYLYLAERTKNADLHTHIGDIHKHNYETLDKVRESQIRREQEIARTQEEFGKGVIEAIQQTTVVSEELRRLYHVRK